MSARESIPAATAPDDLLSALSALVVSLEHLRDTLVADIASNREPAPPQGKRARRRARRGGDRA